MDSDRFELPTMISLLRLLTRPLVTMMPAALLSGALGAAASCLAKFSLSSSSPLLSMGNVCLEHFGNAEPGGFDVCDSLVLLLRALCFLCTILLNVGMVGTFLEGMEESGSVAGTGLASAANFVVSAMLGTMLWGEHVSFTWFCGFVLVVLGVGLLSSVKIRPVS